MLSPDNHLGIFAALMGLAAIAFWLQTTRIGALLTGTVMVILMAIVAANAGLIPHQAPCLLYTSPSPRDRQKSRMPSSA